ncbi:MAG: sensor domain-containing diguanylate cyclase [Armatimonadota bacterium]
MKSIRKDKLSFAQLGEFFTIHYLGPWCLLLIAVSVSFLIYSYSIRNESRQSQLQFKLLAKERVSSIYNRVTNNNTVVNAVASFFNSTEYVGRSEFSIFVQPFIKDNESIQALQWVPRILNKDRKRYEKSARNDGLIDFQFKQVLDSGELKPASIRDDYYVIYFNEPLSKNMTVMGFDNGSEILRRKILLDVAAKGVMACSPPIKLLQAVKGQKGYLVYVPVYKTGVIPPTPKERLKHLTGFATGVFIADELVKSAIGANNLSATRISIDDFTDPADPQNLYSIGKLSTDDSLKGYDYNREYNVGNRIWRFTLTASDQYPMPSMVPAKIRLVFSLLLVFAVFALVLYRMKTARLLHESNMKYRGYIEHSPEGVYLVNGQGKYIEVNHAAMEQTGYSYNELMALSIPEITYPDDLNIAMSSFVELQEKGSATAELRLRKKDGSPIPIILNSVKLQDGNFMAFCTDNSVQKEIERELEILATTDPLTGVSNRRQFFEIGVNEINRAMRYNRSFSVLMMDIDHFKDINDKYGHASGDAILVELATACKMILRDVDKIGRLGGEEFAAILPETNAEGAYALGERLRKALAAMSVVSNAGVIRLTVSIGTAAYSPGDDPNFDAILARADQAMYMAKKQGRDRVVSNGE